VRRHLQEVQEVSYDPAVVSDGYVADVLDEAASYLEDIGWMRHDTGMHGGPRCATGAMESALLERRARERDVKLRAIIKRVEGLMPELLTEKDLKHSYGTTWDWQNNVWAKGVYVTKFNDVQQDKRKVIRFLRRSARVLRGV
jgi:hypothetical protein